MNNKLDKVDGIEKYWFDNKDDVCIICKNNENNNDFYSFETNCSKKTYTGDFRETIAELWHINKIESINHRLCILKDLNNHANLTFHINIISEEGNCEVCKKLIKKLNHQELKIIKQHSSKHYGIISHDYIIKLIVNTLKEFNYLLCFKLVSFS
jgi:hypothetical protein